MDMWCAFRNSVACHAPQTAIVFDKFHIIRHLSAALDQVRHNEYKGGITLWCGARIRFSLPSRQSQFMAAGRDVLGVAGIRTPAGHLLPSAALLGLAVNLTAASFKKYL
ncbi:hypothetical protein AXE65_12570 [Ventosimonas gracilis]|uniref:Transposase IS204/IS1001/IS1096/IS1165 DDE domain-containing protein n=1 Tax=Ventosimonas gracilis TaxID=1680762 RepID=A0A139SW42_9GAMM|nr:hypothetical protein AXE65_12570 [Ventosimonas gracilis]